MAANAWAVLYRASVPRGLTPRSTEGCSRVARTTRTTYSRTDRSTRMRRTSVCNASSSAAVATGCKSSRGSSCSNRSRMRFSSSSVGYPILSLSKKRSTCASGRGKVPSNSMGFWVASTRKGRGKGLVSPSTVICRSCMASRRALCVRGVARLISSASNIWLITGPGLNWNSCSFWLKK